MHLRWARQRQIGYLTLSITNRWKFGVHASSSGSTSAGGRFSSKGFSACAWQRSALGTMRGIS